MKKKFTVKVQETYEKVYTIEAEDGIEAVEIAEELAQNDETIGVSENFKCRDILTPYFIGEVKE